MRAFINKAMFVGFIASIILQMPAAFAEETKAEPISTPPYFTDVEEGNPYFLPINYLYEKGIIHGYDDGTFKPYNKVNRAEALTMTLLAFDLDKNKEKENKEEATVVKFIDIETGKITEENTETTNIKDDVKTSFPDVDETAWYSDAIKTALKNKLVSGYKDGTFKPAQNINLVESLKINLEADKAILPSEVPDEIFKDVSGSEWFSKYVLYAKDLFILNITTKNTIDPLEEMTRGKLAELIYRIHKSKEGYMFGVASYYGDKFNGRNTASGITFDNNAMTAANKTLPFGTVVRVMNPKFDKYVDVTITDRGPYAFGRVLDLSKAAFEAIEYPGAGLTTVQYKVMTQEELDKEREEMIKSAYT